MSKKKKDTTDPVKLERPCEITGCDNFACNDVQRTHALTGDQYITFRCQDHTNHNDKVLATYKIGVVVEMVKGK